MCNCNIEMEKLDEKGGLKILKVIFRMLDLNSRLDLYFTLKLHIV